VVMASCAAPKASKELWVNNVRTIVYSGGDMWWDMNGNGNAYYYNFFHIQSSLN